MSLTYNSDAEMNETLFSIPDELTLYVLQFLSNIDLSRFSLVSQQAYRLVNDKGLWKNKLLERCDMKSCCDSSTIIPPSTSWKTLYYSIVLGKVHNRSCTKCYKFPIEGPLYKCFHCRNYFLCEDCFNVHSVNEEERHEEGHLFLKIRHPDSIKNPLLYFQFPKGKQRVHKHRCSDCGVSPIIGSRYKCRQCKDFCLCEGCHKKENVLSVRSPGIKRHKSHETHNTSHAFTELLFHEKKHSAHDSPTWCDACTKPITGKRFKCLNCFNYDLCVSCEASEKHKNGEKHCFLVLDGVSLCCYNLQYLDWTEKNDYTSSIMSIQHLT